MPTQDSRRPDTADSAFATENRSALEVTVSYGDAVLDVRHLMPPRGLIVGEGKAVDLAVSTDELPVSEFPLLRCEGDAFVLTFCDSQRGEIDLGDGAIHPLKWFQNASGVTRDSSLPKCWRYVLPRTARASLRFAGVTLAMTFVTPPERLFEPRAHRDYRYAAAVFAGSVLALVAMAFSFVFGSTTPEPYLPAAGADAELRSARLVQATLVPSLFLVTDPLILGALSQDDVMRALAAAKPEIEGCLRSAEGFIDARVRIDAGGTVGAIDVRIVPAGSTACLSDALGRLSFPPPIDGQASVELRFR